MHNIENYEKKLSSCMSKGLEQIPRVVTHGPKRGRRIALLYFNVDDLRPLELALELEKSARIMVRVGHHCALPLIKSTADKTGTVRTSAYFYNTKGEIERLIQEVKLIVRARGTRRQRRKGHD